MHLTGFDRDSKKRKKNVQNEEIAKILNNVPGTNKGLTHTGYLFDLNFKGNLFSRAIRFKAFILINTYDDNIIKPTSTAAANMQGISSHTVNVSIIGYKARAANFHKTDFIARIRSLWSRALFNYG